MNNLNQGASEAERVIEAVRKLVKAKGRFHTEQNYKALADALDSYDAARRTPAATTGDGELPPLPAWLANPKRGDAMLTSAALKLIQDYARAAIEADRAQRQVAPASAQPADPEQCTYPSCACIGGGVFKPCAKQDGAQPDQRESAAVPDGWKLVPIKPTDEMFVAFAEQWYSKARCVDDCQMEDCYAAMLAAAPAPGNTREPTIAYISERAAEFLRLGASTSALMSTVRTEAESVAVHIAQGETNVG